MSYHILYESTPWHTRCVLFDEHGQPMTIRIEDASRPYTEGAIVYGRVRSVAKPLGAAFVDIGDVQDALLPLDTLPQGPKLTQGQGIVARITREGFGEKGARLDARAAMKPPTPNTPCPSVIKSAPSALTRILHDAGPTPVTVWLHNAADRDVVARQIPEKSIRQIDHDDDFATYDWDERVDTLIDTVLSPAPTFPFGPSGMKGTLIVEMTSAVATIDVNMGVLQGATKENAVLTANLMAAEEIARLCRLLDLGGSVIVDFITPRSKAHRQVIGDTLKATFETTDDHFVELRPMSRHGLLELTRERIGPSLPLTLRTATYMAGHIGLLLWRTPAGANPKLRSQTVVAHPDVIRALQHHLTQDMCLRALGRPVHFKADGALPITQFSISG
jgi:hypothetical protein